MARKYDMVTVFSDYYDHLSDLSKIIAIEEKKTNPQDKPNDYFKCVKI